MGEEAVNTVVTSTFMYRSCPAVRPQCKTFT